jgi:16S rRNA (cytosine967-C5)-methyltransferase
LKKDSRYIAFKLLEEYFESDLYINDIISDYFDKKNLETTTKNFTNNLVLGVVRMKGKYDYILSSLYHGDYKKIKNKIRYILYIGVHQIEEMDSVPDHAAISTTVDIAKSLFPGLDKLVNALLRKFISKIDKYKLNKDDHKTYPLLSHPSWLLNKWIINFGLSKTIDICNFNNSSQNLWFRINKQTDKTVGMLIEEGFDVEFNEIHNLFFKTNNPHALIKSKIFNDGFLSIQNPINGFIVDLLEPKNLDTIIDGCSAPGGKGTLISLKAPKSNIISIDNNIYRTKKIREAIRRHNIKNMEILIKNLSTDKLPQSNKILLDVPCTGSGVINRRVDIKWRRTEKELKDISLLQYKILSNAAKYLDADGIIVYSTCSIEPEENELLIERFIDTHNFIVEDAANFVNNNIVQGRAIKVLPGEHSLDGGFAIRLKKI